MPFINCRRCGRHKKISPSRLGKTVYCGKDCLNADRQDTHVQVACDSCGTLIERPQSLIHEENYCNDECRLAGRKNEVQFPCWFCGEPVICTKEKMEEGRRFCSQGCRHAWEKQEGVPRGYGSSSKMTPAKQRVLNNIIEKLTKKLNRQPTQADIIRKYLADHADQCGGTSADIAKGISDEYGITIRERSVGVYKKEIGVAAGKTKYTWDVVNELMADGDGLVSDDPCFTTSSIIKIKCGICKEIKEKKLRAYLYNGPDHSVSPHCRECNRKRVGEINREHQTGRTHSEESKEKMRKIMTGRKITWADKISAAHLARRS